MCPVPLPATHSLYQVMESVEMNHTGVTPVELNENLPNTLFKLNPMSRLKSYMISKTGVEKTYYSLLELLTVLKDIIRGEGMLDYSNPSVILCSQDLEEALNMRALHVTEIRDLIWSHLTRVPAMSATPAVLAVVETTPDVADGAPVEQAVSLAHVVEGVLHASVTEDAEILDVEIELGPTEFTQTESILVEQTQVENIRDFMRCTSPNCSFCQTVSFSTGVEASDGCPTPDMCLPGMRQAGIIAPVTPFDPHAPKVYPELLEPMARMAPGVHCAAEPKRKRDVRTSSIKAEIEITESPEATEEVIEESNFIDLQRDEPTASEVFLLSRAYSPLVFTQVGSGSVKNNKTKGWEDVKILFDQGSSECWITESFAKDMGCKPLDNWEGFLTTVNGREKIDRPAVEFTLFNFESQQTVKIQAIVNSSKVISKKPRILDEKFQGLCSAFSLKPGQVDNSEGPCHILIGLKNQSIQTSRICSFKSGKFPEVGVYRSPVMKYMIFVGQHTVRPKEVTFPTTLESKIILPEWSSFSAQTSCDNKTFDTKLQEFLTAETRPPHRYTVRNMQQGS